MNRVYWNRIGGNYNREIFHALESDKNKLLEQLIRKNAIAGGVAADFGCGTGQFLRLLSVCFGRVLAMDHSPELLAQAAARHRHLQNIEFYNCDLVQSRHRFTAPRFALCVNVLIMDDYNVRARILQTIRGAQRKDGVLLLVVPSLESVFLTQQRLMEWNLREGQTPRQAAAGRIPGLNRRALARLHEGVIPIDGVSTKHYLREELLLLLEGNGYRVKSMNKVEYDWKTEFTAPPRWMRDPYPWDWAVLAQKIIPRRTTWKREVSFRV